MFRDIFRPFSYLGIEHPSNLPQVVNWIFPILSAFIFTYGFYILDKNANLNFYGISGFLDKILGITQCLAGFYIAALAAVASLNNSHMDALMPGKPTKMKIRYNGVLQKIPLTRRRYLCTMFAFLTAYSLIISFGIVFSLAIAPNLYFINESFKLYIWILGVFVFMLLIFQMITVTFWGLYYLGERVHTPD